MWQCQLIAVLILLGTTLVASLPVNSPLIKDGASFKAVESFDAEDGSTSSSSLSTARTTVTPDDDSELFINATQSLNHTWSGMEDPNLFEGDLKVSKEIIEKYYGKLKSTNSTKV